MLPEIKRRAGDEPRSMESKNERGDVIRDVIRDMLRDAQTQQQTFKHRSKLVYAFTEEYERTRREEVEGILQLQRGIVIISVCHDGEGTYEVEFERKHEGLSAILETLSPVNFKLCPRVRGEGTDLCSHVLSVREKKGQFKPGNYSIRTKTSGLLLCQVIQPEIRQTPQIPPYFRPWIELGGLFYNTVRIGKAPLTFRGYTRGSLTANLFSFDGEEQTTLEILDPGPFHSAVEGTPGTEYLVQIDAEKKWDMQCEPDLPR